MTLRESSPSVFVLSFIAYAPATGFIFIPFALPLESNDVGPVTTNLLSSVSSRTETVTTLFSWPFRLKMVLFLRSRLRSLIR
jgi:hypothetical protein